MSDTPIIKPSPMRILRAWLFRERAVRGPGAIELGVVERQVDREVAAIGSAVSAAAGIERRLDRVRGQLRAALTDRKTPGIVDADESRGIARALNGTSVVAHNHTAELEALT
jgi:hypothetical protein